MRHNCCLYCGPASEELNPQIPRRGSKDLEIEYALIPEAGAYIPVAAVLPTLIGTVHVNAVGLTITNSDRKD